MSGARDEEEGRDGGKKGGKKERVKEGGGGEGGMVRGREVKAGSRKTKN